MLCRRCLDPVDSDEVKPKEAMKKQGELDYHTCQEKITGRNKNTVYANKTHNEDMIR